MRSIRARQLKLSFDAVRLFIRAVTDESWALSSGSGRRGRIRTAPGKRLDQNVCHTEIHTQQRHNSSLDRQGYYHVFKRELRPARSTVSHGSQALTTRRAAVLCHRNLSTVRDAPITSPSSGPLERYDERVHFGALRSDEHQRTIVEHLQDLHEMLRAYKPPPVIHPEVASLHSSPTSSFFGSLFSRSGRRSAPPSSIPNHLPRGVYMYGDVGSGKTMLMDLFYETLPSNIPAKTRIHFHNFMQDVHRRLHRVKMEQESNFDAIPLVAADLAEAATVLCFDEFQCTDVADAMILRRLLDSLMSHGVVLVTTSNRHPDELYKNGIQRASFIPCIHLIKRQLRVLNLDSDTDYRQLPRPPSGVYYHPLDQGARKHAEKWFGFLGDPVNDPPHAATVTVWGRDVHVPQASGKAAQFTFAELIGQATGAADYLELVKAYESFIVTDVPGMTYRQRDWARRFITFIDAVYESGAKLVLTSQVPLAELFISREEMKAEKENPKDDRHGDRIHPSDPSATISPATNYITDRIDDDTIAMADLLEDTSVHRTDTDHHQDSTSDGVGLSMASLRASSVFSGDEERFAFARALSRLSEMGSQLWVERGMGLEKAGGKKEKEGWQRVRSRWKEDSM